MTAVVPINSDLSASDERPGVYFQIRTGGGGSALADAFRRVIIWGHKTSSGTAPLNSLTRCPSVSDAITYAGQGSDLCRQYQAFASQAGNGVADVYLLPVTDPGGTAATRKIIFAGSPTTAGSFDVWVCGYLHSIRCSTSDTATTLGDALIAALNANVNLPMTFANGAGTVTGTYRHTGLIGNDVPIIVNKTGAAGITVSAGTVTYATDPTGSAGSTTVTIGGTTITTAIDPAVETTVSLIATKVAAAINAGAYPCTATSSSGVVTLLFATDRVVNKVSAAIVTFTATTVTVACGTVAPNNGSNKPTLTTALANLANFAGGARIWITPFNESTTTGTMATHIELMQNGQYQRDQFLFWGSNDGIVTAGALPAATTPVLTALWRYCGTVEPDSPQQGCEIGARMAGLVAAEDYAPKNYDGALIHSDAAGAVPNLLPHPAVRLAPSGDDAQTALHTYGLNPIAVSAAGSKVVVKARTTWQTDNTLRDVGKGQGLAVIRIAMVGAGSAVIAGKNIRRNGTPRTENTITLVQIRSALVAKARDLDNLDLFDGVDAWKDSIQLAFNGSDPTRVDGFIPMPVPPNLHQLGLVGSPQ